MVCTNSNVAAEFVAFDFDKLSANAGLNLDALDFAFGGRAVDLVHRDVRLSPTSMLG
jgi:hypothetical protein